jgi:hypothetical protein
MPEFLEISRFPDSTDLQFMRLPIFGENIERFRFSQAQRRGSWPDLRNWGWSVS